MRDKSTATHREVVQAWQVKHPAVSHVEIQQTGQPSEQTLWQLLICTEIPQPNKPDLLKLVLPLEEIFWQCCQFSARPTRVCVSANPLQPQRKARRGNTPSVLVRAGTQTLPLHPYTAAAKTKPTSSRASQATRQLPQLQAPPRGVRTIACRRVGVARTLGFQAAVPGGLRRHYSPR